MGRAKGVLGVFVKALERFPPFRSSASMASRAFAASFLDMHCPLDCGGNGVESGGRGRDEAPNQRPNCTGISAPLADTCGGCHPEGRTNGDLPVA